MTAQPACDPAVVDLLGTLAYATLTGFSRVAADSDEAPTTRARVALGRLATMDFAAFERIATRLAEMGVDVDEAMAPFVAAVDRFHDRTAPTTWGERLVKAYVGDGIANDFYRELSAHTDPGVRDLVTQVVDDGVGDDYFAAMIREVIADDPTSAGRLALWGRRLVGEALSQAQQVVADRDSLVELLVGGGQTQGPDLAEVGRMFVRLTDAHSARMTSVGLAP